MSKQWFVDNTINFDKLADTIHEQIPANYSIKARTWYDDNLSVVDEKRIIQAIANELCSLDKRVDPEKAAVKDTINKAFDILKTKYPVNKDVILPFTFITGEQLNEMPVEPIEFLVEDLLPADGISMLVGAQKAGKSTLALQLACAICNGDPIFNRKTKTGDVLYLDLEGTIGRIQKRLKDGKAPVNLIICQNRDGTVNKLSQGFIQQLDYMIKQRTNIRLVIIDHWALLADRGGKRNQNAYEAGQANTDEIRDWAHQNKIAVLLLYHQRKRSPNQRETDVLNSYVGGASIWGAAEAQWVLEKKSDCHPEYHTLLASGRDFENGDISLRLHRTNTGFDYNGSEEEFQKRECKQSGLYKIIIDHVRSENPWITNATDLSDEYFNLSGEQIAPNKIKPKLNKIDQVLNDSGIVCKYKTTGKVRQYIFSRKNYDDVNILIENK